MKISFVGAGNVAWHLSQAFEEAGHWICEIYSRNQQKAEALAAILYDTNVQPDLNFSDSEAELIVIAVSDDAIESIFKQIVFPENAIVVHTSGTVTLDQLRKFVEIHSDVFVHTGVFYPLQTFSKAMPMDYKSIPLCIESTNELIEAKLIKLAESVSEYVRRIDSEERAILHVAAVFASNFVNHLLSISHDLLDREQLDFDLLKPLIATTVQKAMDVADPATVQTGPAVRGDWSTTNRHLAYLQKFDPEWIDIYRHITEQIRLRHIAK